MIILMIINMLLLLNHYYLLLLYSSRVPDGPLMETFRPRTDVLANAVETHFPSLCLACAFR